MSAPASRSIRTQETKPFFAASCRGVTSKRSLALTFAVNFCIKKRQLAIWLRLLATFVTFCDHDFSHFKCFDL